MTKIVQPQWLEWAKELQFKANVSPEDTLYIGDSIYDIQCADNAGVDSGLVLWSNNVSNPIRADYYFNTPNDISKIL